ncbi:MAG: hypothetical protein IJN60_05805 [Oscillospiraceae bacterium]|nr:hypothetical protein [Oscillospiraceae bacterium]
MVHKLGLDYGIALFQAEPLTVKNHFVAFDSYVLDIVAASHISAEGLALQRMDTIFKRDKSFTVGDIIIDIIAVQMNSDIAPQPLSFFSCSLLTTCARTSASEDPL